MSSPRLPTFIMVDEICYPPIAILTKKLKTLVFRNCRPVLEIKKNVNCHFIYFKTIWVFCPAVAVLDPRKITAAVQTFRKVLRTPIMKIVSRYY